MKHTKTESSSSSEVFGKQLNYHSTSDSSDDNQYNKKSKYKPYEDIFGEFKKIKPPTFNGETEKGEEAESWLSRMKKYFQIYNYSNQLLRPGNSQATTARDSPQSTFPTSP